MIDKMEGCPRCKGTGQIHHPITGKDLVCPTCVTATAAPEIFKKPMCTLTDVETIAAVFAVPLLWHHLETDEQIWDSSLKKAKEFLKFARRKK